jgi:tol-pal system protein YbgF
MKQLLWMPLAVTGLLLAGSAAARGPDPVQIKLDDIDARLGRVEAVVNNQSLLDLSRRIDALETQMRQLRGSVEESQNGSDSLRKQQRDLYADLDKRLAALETVAKSLASTGDLPASGGSSAGAVPAAGADSDQAAYNRAIDVLKGGDYPGAIRQWRAFLSAYPSSSLQDNAQYWLGEAYYVTRDYDSAETAFKTVGERWPDSRKAPDALLKLGYAQFEKKQLAEARATLQLVQKKYPGTDAARLAGERLSRMGT